MNVKLLKLLLLYFLLASQTLLLAKKFDVKMTYPFESSLFDVTQDYNGDIAIVGFSKKFITSSKQPKSYSDAFSYLAATQQAEGEQMHMLKLNANAEKTYDKRLSLPHFNHAVSLVKSTQHQYFIGGYTQNGELLLIKLDAQKNITQFTKFGTAHYDAMHQLLALKDGGVLAIGSSMTSRDVNDALFEQGLGLNDIYVSRFDKNARLLWSKKYGTEFDDRGISAAEAYDGTILIVGTTDEKQKRSLTLLRVSEQGDTLWNKRYKESRINDVSSVITLKNKTFLIAMSYYNSAMKKQIRLVNFDLQYNILAKRDIQSNFNQRIYAIKEASNSNIIAVGKIEDFKNSNTNALAIYLNPNLQVLWKKEFGDTNYDIFKNVSILNDSHFVAVGTATPSHQEKSDMWVVKLNPDGSISHKKSDTELSLYDLLCQNFAKEIAKKQLNITQDLRITLHTSTLEFPTGVASLSSHQKLFLKKFIPKLVKTLKSHQEVLKAISVNGYASSIWNTKSSDSRYLKNHDLSSERAKNSLHEIYKSIPNSSKKWFRNLLESHALSYKERIMKNSVEDTKRSQRVTIELHL